MQLFLLLHERPLESKKQVVPRHAFNNLGLGGARGGGYAALLGCGGPATKPLPSMPIGALRVAPNSPVLMLETYLQLRFSIRAIG
jgi:hypothetical protein